jgi:hypothetical protein
MPVGYLVGVIVVALPTLFALVPLRSVPNLRLFADTLGRVSTNPVVYAELPGAQHAFDLFGSLRFELVVDAIEAFTAWARSREIRSGHDLWLEY